MDKSLPLFTFVPRHYDPAFTPGLLFHRFTVALCLACWARLRFHESRPVSKLNDNSAKIVNRSGFVTAAMRTVIGTPTADNGVGSAIIAVREIFLRVLTA